MIYAKLYDEVLASDLGDDLKKAIKARLSDPTYSDEYIKRMVQWIKVALYAGDDYELRLLIFSVARKRKGAKKDVH